jgi:hypothetical protein
MGGPCATRFECGHGLAWAGSSSYLTARGLARGLKGRVALKGSDRGRTLVRPACRAAHALRSCSCARSVAAQQRGAHAAWHAQQHIASPPQGVRQQPRYSRRTATSAQRALLVVTLSYRLQGSGRGGPSWGMCWPPCGTHGPSVQPSERWLGAWGLGASERGRRRAVCGGVHTPGSTQGPFCVRTALPTL